jgi:hypothetical protein
MKYTKLQGDSHYLGGINYVKLFLKKQTSKSIPFIEFGFLLTGKIT